MYPTASKWLKELEEGFSVHSHPWEGNPSSREREVFSTMMGNKDSANFIPRPYKNEMTFQYCFPCFFLWENTKCWTVGFSFLLFFLCHSYQGTLYILVFFLLQNNEGEKQFLILLSSQDASVLCWERKWLGFPPPNQNTYVVGGFLSQNTTFGYFILSAIYNFLKMSEHLMQVEWLEWTSPWNQFTCKVWNLFEYHLNSQWLLVD